VSDAVNPMAVPLRRTPVAFRCWLAGVVVAVVAGFALLGMLAPGPSVFEIIRNPALLVLIGLILVADLYPTLPWMKDSNPFDEFILSTPLVMAALFAFGPHAAFCFLITGATVTVALGMVWWRVILNIALWGLQGVLAAGALVLLTQGYDWSEPMPVIWMLPLSFALAIVIEASNIALVGTSVTLAGAFAWREYFSDWRNQIAIAALALTAPIPAALALHDPALLPVLALAMIAAQLGISQVASQTAAAGTDALTSLANRATLVNKLRHRLSRLRRATDSVTLLLVDLDGFKAVNDRYGHLAGDRVLVEVAQRLEASTRSADLVARFGGDEFAVLLADGAPLRTAEDVALRMRDAVARPIDIGGRAVRVGASVGWATAIGEPFDPQTLLARADAELYRAKAARPAAPAVIVEWTSGHGALLGGGKAESRLADLWDGPRWSWTAALDGAGRRPDRLAASEPE
jgi:diguanylate cyclase